MCKLLLYGLRTGVKGLCSKGIKEINGGEYNRASCFRKSLDALCGLQNLYCYGYTFPVIYRVI